jgi:preprotein translocase subunit SecF
MKTIRFSKGFVPAIVLSSAMVILALTGLIVRGLNLGVDFRAGINETIRLAVPALRVSYQGEGNATLRMKVGGADLVLSGTKEADVSVPISYKEVSTLSALASALESAVPGVKADLVSDGSLPSSSIISTAQADTRLDTQPRAVYRAVLSPSEAKGGIEDIRAALATVGESAVQAVGAKGDYSYMLRVEDDGTDPNFAANIKTKITAALESKLGAESFVALKTDFVGARFSKDLGRNTFFVVFFALAAILVYATLRFKPQYAIGAVLAIIHDALAMLAFIIWTGMEFNTSTIAAILTILGFSINDTIVIFDRIREDRQLKPDMPYRDLLDSALTETLSRTIITTLTTLICVTVLFVATSGTMKDFALALIVGMVSGTYSTIYIASAFVAYWQETADKLKRRKAEKAKAAKAKTAQA